MTGGCRDGQSFAHTTRRDALVAGFGFFAALTVKASAVPKEGEVAAAIAAFTRDAAVQQGGVTLSLPPLVEDGDYARLSFCAETWSRPQRLGIFSSGNPLPLVAVYRLGPAALPRLSTNIRLWRTQTVTAVAEIGDGTFRAASAEVTVTLAACRSE